MAQIVFLCWVKLSSHAHSAMGLSELYHSDAKLKGVCVQMRQSAPALAKSSAIFSKTFPACPLMCAKKMQAPRVALTILRERRVGA